MAPTTTLEIPPVVDPGLLEPRAYEIVRRPLTETAAIERARRWSQLLEAHPVPEGAGPTARRVWAALLDASGPLTSQELATMFDRHRGNIDRALAPLKEAGLVRTSPNGEHRAVPRNRRRR